MRFHTKWCNFHAVSCKFRVKCFVGTFTLFGFWFIFIMCHCDRRNKINADGKYNFSFLDLVLQFRIGLDYLIEFAFLRLICAQPSTIYVCGLYCTFLRAYANNTCIVYR